MIKKNKPVIVGLIICACLFIISVSYIFYLNGKKDQEKVDNDDVISQVLDENADADEIPVDFDALQEINSDIYAWITIDGTEVNAPILQNAEVNELYDEYYLDHLYNKVKGFSGSLFTQKINTTTFEDANTVVYGHNMKNLEAFGSLKKYKDKQYFDDHKEIIVYTPDHTYKYDIFAAVTFGDEHLMIKYNFSIPSELERYISDLKASDGIIDENVEVGANDKLLTLSTCTNITSDRYLVVGKLVEVK